MRIIRPTAFGILALLSFLFAQPPVLSAQGSRQISEYDAIQDKDRDNPAARAAWFLRGRLAPQGESAAALRYKAYQQKLAMRRWLAANPAFASPALSGSGWQSLGPAPMISLAAGTGQDYNFVTGRATAVAIDPADTSGNTIFIGGAHGGIWKSTNAANPTASAITWTPVADYAGTLAVGSIAIKPGNSNPATSTILVGSGEPNNSADSYYGLGILRSTDGGNTWTLITQDNSGRSFAGLGISKIAFSTSNPQLVVAAAATASEGVVEGLPNQNNRGIYYSNDGGVTWNHASITDNGTPTSVASVTSVVYNASANKFFAAVRFHGVYSSGDGVNWTRLADANQPGTNLTSSLCPAVGAATCLFYRAELAVVPGRNEMYTWVVDVNTITGSETDGGIWNTLNAGTAAWTQIGDGGITNCGDPNGEGCGVSQGDYNLEILALPNGSTATDLYAGAINLYKCGINSPSSPNTSCSFINLTHVYGCSSIARVHPDQHHLAGMIVNGTELMYFANDGGIYRALNGYTGLTTGTCGGSNQFDSLNGTLGSMTQFVWFSIHPTTSSVLFGGTQDNGSPTTNSGLPSLEWQNIHPGDGGYNIITPTSPNDWYATYPDTGQGTLRIDHCASGSSCTALGFTQVIGSNNLGGDNGAFYFPFILDPQNAAAMLVGTCRLWRVSSPTNPTGFAALSNNFEPSGSLPCTGGEVNLARSIAAGGPKDSSGRSKVIYVGTDGNGPIIGGSPTGGRIFVTTDASVGAPVFNEVTSTINPNAYPVSNIVIDPTDATGQTAYVGIMGFMGGRSSTGHIYKTVNAGQTWTNNSGTLPDSPVNSLLIDSASSTLYAGTDVGVFSTPTSSPNWTEVGPAAASGTLGFLPNVPVTALQLFNSGGQKILRASTYGRGIWQYALVTTPDYAINVTNSPLTVFASQTGTLSGTLTASSGYSSPVTLTCTAGTSNPPTTCTPSSPVTPTSTGAPLTVSVSGAIGNYTFNIHGIGSDSSRVTHDAPVTMEIVDFQLSSPSPASLSVAQGSISNPVSLTVTSLGSFTGTVSLTCSSGLPTGVTCGFSPATVSLSPGTSVPVSLTFSAASSATIGTSTVTLSANTSGAPAAKTQPLSLTVTAPVPDYQLAVSNSPLAAPVNTSGTFQGTLIALNAYNSPVNLSCGSGAPPTCTVQPASLTPTTTGAAFTVTVQSNAIQNYTFNVNGAGTDSNHTNHFFPVTFNSLFSFSLADTTGTQAVHAGQTATYTLTFTPAPGFAFPNAIQPACDQGLPLGVSCSFNPAQVNANATGTQTITLSVTTTGPNMQAHIIRTSESRPLAPWFAWVPATGLVLGGLSRQQRARKRLAVVSSLLLVAGLLLILPSCGSNHGGGSGISVSVSPGSKTLFPTQTQQFTAAVSGTTNTAVTWSASGGGTIDTNGNYTAPASISQDTQATVTATSQADLTKTGIAAVTLKAPTPAGNYTIHVTATSGSGSSLFTQTTTAGLTVN
jgi:hypothetical protein